MCFTLFSFASDRMRHASGSIQPCGMKGRGHRSRKLSNLNLLPIREVSWPGSPTRGASPGLQTPRPQATPPSRPPSLARWLDPRRFPQRGWHRWSHADSPTRQTNGWQPVPNCQTRADRRTAMRTAKLGGSRIVTKLILPKLGGSLIRLVLSSGRPLVTACKRGRPRAASKDVSRRRKSPARTTSQTGLKASSESLARGRASDFGRQASD